MNLVLDMGDAPPPTFVPEHTAGSVGPPVPDRPALPPPQYSQTDDVDMQRAVAASLTDAPRADEDDALLQALTESMSQDSVAKELVEDIRSRKRVSGAPVALVAPAPVFQITTQMVQALLAAAPFRAALSSAPRDLRTVTDDYWAGSSPEVPPGVTINQNEICTQLLTVVQRLQTLAKYVEDTEHGAVIVGDVAGAVPRDLLHLACRGDTHTLVESTLLLTDFIDAIAALYADDAQMSALYGLDAKSRAAFSHACDHLFRSYAAPAAAGAPLPGIQDTLVTHSITLRHTSSDANVSSCLWSKLAGGSDADSILITRPADVLALPIIHAAGMTRFNIDEIIYLDSFLWEKRNGERIDNDDRWRQIEIYDATCNELLRRREQLVSPSVRCC